ncbi:MAG TPA: PEGA domain-containing protein, partial [Gemmata sp.]|nr:PEGA domain-containing protein [Gemmata sp.]
MTSGRAWGLGAILAAAACAGCVDRRFVVESNIPNAQVYIDNLPVGAAPAHSPFEYYGNYTFTVVHPGFETKTEVRHI